MWKGSWWLASPDLKSGVLELLKTNDNKAKPGNDSNVAALSILTGWDATAFLQKGDSLCRMVA